MALYFPMKRIFLLMKRPFTIPWLVWWNAHLDILHTQIRHWIGRIAQNNSGRDNRIVNVNVPQSNIFKLHTALCRASCGTGKRICQRTFQAKANIWLVLLLWSDPNWPPKRIIHVNFIVSKSATTIRNQARQRESDISYCYNILAINVTSRPINVTLTLCSLSELSHSPAGSHFRHF